MFSDRHRNTGQVSFLESIGADGRGINLAGEGDHGDRIHMGSSNSGDKIGGARSGRR